MVPSSNNPFSQIIVDMSENKVIVLGNKLLCYVTSRSAL